MWFFSIFKKIENKTSETKKKLSSNSKQFVQLESKICNRSYPIFCKIPFFTTYFFPISHIQFNVFLQTGQVCASYPWLNAIFSIQPFCGKMKGLFLFFLWSERQKHLTLWIIPIFPKLTTTTTKQYQSIESQKYIESLYIFVQFKWKPKKRISKLNLNNHSSDIYLNRRYSCTFILSFQKLINCTKFIWRRRRRKCFVNTLRDEIYFSRSTKTKKRYWCEKENEPSFVVLMNDLQIKNHHVFKHLGFEWEKFCLDNHTKKINLKEKNKT